MLFEDENILRPSEGVVLNQYEARQNDPLELRCPHCSVLGIFTSTMPSIGYAKALKGQSKTRSQAMMATIRVCPNQACRGIVFTISHGGTKFQILPSETIDFNTDDLPLNLVKTLKEAIVCHANGAYRAASMMIRRLLEELCEESGATGKSLFDRLKSLRSKVVLSDELFDAMDELKALGNDAAHVEAKAYTNIDAIEAEISIGLAKEILKARYQQKALVARLRSLRSKP